MCHMFSSERLFSKVSFVSRHKDAGCYIFIIQPPGYFVNTHQRWRNAAGSDTDRHGPCFFLSGCYMLLSHKSRSGLPPTFAARRLCRRSAQLRVYSEARGYRGEYPLKTPSGVRDSSAGSACYIPILGGRTVAVRYRLYPQFLKALRPN